MKRIIILSIAFFAGMCTMNIFYNYCNSKPNKQYALVTDATNLLQISAIKIRTLIIDKKDDNYIFSIFFNTPENLELSNKKIEISKNTMLDYFGKNTFLMEDNFKKATITNCKGDYTHIAQNCEVDYWLILDQPTNYTSESVQSDILSLFNLYVIKLNSLHLYQNNNNWYLFSEKGIDNPKIINPKPEKIEYEDPIYEEAQPKEQVDVDSEEFQENAPEELKELIKKEKNNVDKPKVKHKTKIKNR